MVAHWLNLISQGDSLVNHDQSHLFLGQECSRQTKLEDGPKCLVLGQKCFHDLGKATWVWAVWAAQASTGSLKERWLHHHCRRMVKHLGSETVPAESSLKQGLHGADALDWLPEFVVDCHGPVARHVL